MVSVMTKRAGSVVQQVLLALGVTQFDEAMEVPDLGTRLLLAEQLKAELGVRLDDVDVLQANTVGDLIALAVPPARAVSVRPSAEGSDADVPDADAPDAAQPGAEWFDARTEVRR